MTNKPVFKNEVIGEYGGSTAPVYKIITDRGVELGRIQLANPIIQEGTPLNADNLNAIIAWVEENFERKRLSQPDIRDILQYEELSPND